jgi:hypothetical protein
MLADFNNSHHSRSTAARSSGEDLSTCDYGGLGSETYSSSEGENDSSSIYGMPMGLGNDSSYYSDEIDVVENPDMILPMPRIPTPSPVQSQLLLVDTLA